MEIIKAKPNLGSWCQWIYETQSRKYYRETENCRYVHLWP
jgi:hypothetical protein